MKGFVSSELARLVDARVSGGTSLLGWGVVIVVYGVVGGRGEGPGDRRGGATGTTEGGDGDENTAAELPVRGGEARSGYVRLGAA